MSPDPAAPSPVQLIVPRWIAPVEPDDAVLEGHAVVVRDGRIDAVLPVEDAVRRHPDAQAVHLPGHLLIPRPGEPPHARGDEPAARRGRRPAARALAARAHLAARGGAGVGRLRPRRHRARLPRDAARRHHHLQRHVLLPRGGRARGAVDGMRAMVGIIVVDFPSAYGSGPGDYLAKGFALRDAMRHEPRSASRSRRTRRTPCRTTLPRGRQAVGGAPAAGPRARARDRERGGRARGEARLRPLARLERLGLVGPN